MAKTDLTNSKLIPGIGRIPFPAYRGKEPYIFVSYAHADAEMVFAEISRFNKQGYKIWYDEGIAPGNEWTDEIADALSGCALFLVFITPNSAASSNVRDEIHFALDENIPFISIHLKETELKGGLKLRIGAKQAILKYNMSEEEYLYKYSSAFNQYGFEIPAIMRDHGKTDSYVPLEMCEDDVSLIAKILYTHWKEENRLLKFEDLDAGKTFQYNAEALRLLCIACAADAGIYPADYSMGKRVFPGRIDFRILENAQKLFIHEMNDLGYTNGKFDWKNRTYPLEPLGYRSEQEEDKMEQAVSILQDNGFDYFRHITCEEKEDLIKEVYKEIQNTDTPEKLEIIRRRYKNLAEIVDMINDALFRL